MVERKRDRLGVIYDILSTIQAHNNSIKPTPLLRYSNLSSKSFADYFDELLNKKFVKVLFDSKDKKYITLTDKGFKYLAKYQTITNFISEFEL